MTVWACRFGLIYLMAGLACAGTLEFEVTSAGAGANPSLALRAARENALVDVFKVVAVGDAGKRTSADPIVVSSKVLSTRRITQERVEVVVKARVRTSSDLMAQQPLLGVAILADTHQAQDASTLELVQTVRDLLEGNGMASVPPDHPSVFRALQRLQIVGATAPPKGKVQTSRSLPADVLCMVSVKEMEQVGQDFRLTTQVVLLQSYGTSRHEIRTVQTSVTGDPTRGTQAVQVAAALQIVKLASGFAMRQSAIALEPVGTREALPRASDKTSHGIILESDW